MSTTDRDQTAIDRWTKDAQFFEYSKAANPIGSGLTSKVPLADFPRHLHEEGPTRIVPFDLSEQLRCPGPATSPALCANFIHILPGERLETRPEATSEVYYVIRGRGRSRLPDGDLAWQEGDFFALPSRVRGRAPSRERRGLLLGPRRAPAALPGRQARRAPVRADPVPAGNGRSEAGRS